MKKNNLECIKRIRNCSFLPGVRQITACLIFAVFIVTSIPLNTISESAISEYALTQSAFTSEEISTENKITANNFASVNQTDSLSFSKDETVYAMLNTDGSFDGKVTIVNYIHPMDKITDSQLTDYGIYDNLSPLSINAEYSISDGREILWKFGGADDLPEGFFYRGEKSGTMLPFIFDVKYYLDGKVINPGSLAGKSGNFKLEIAVTSNNSIYSYYLQNFAAQIQVPLSTLYFSQINAPESSSVLTGQTRILNLTVLPGKSQTFTIEAKVTHFEMDEIRIAITPFSTDIIKQVIPDDTNDKLDELSRGVQQIAGGGLQLNQGIIELTEGISEINEGFKDLSEGQTGLFGGIDEYLSGIKEIADGHSALSSGLEEVSYGGVGLTLAYEDLRNEISSLLDSLQSAIDTLPEEERLPVIERIAIVKEQLNIYDHHLNQYIDVIANISLSSNELSDGLTSISGENENIQAGMSGLVMGSENFALGLNTFENESTGLKEGASILSNSLSLLSKELSDASVIFQDLIPEGSNSDPISFADYSTSVSSVNFIISIPSIKMSIPIETQPTEEPVENFWERFLNLFRINR